MIEWVAVGSEGVIVIKVRAVSMEWMGQNPGWRVSREEWKEMK